MQQIQELLFAFETRVVSWKQSALILSRELGHQAFLWISLPNGVMIFIVLILQYCNCLFIFPQSCAYTLARSIAHKRNELRKKGTKLYLLKGVVLRPGLTSEFPWEAFYKFDTETIARQSRIAVSGTQASGFFQAPYGSPVSVGSLGPGAHKVCLSPPSISGGSGV